MANYGYPPVDTSMAETYKGVQTMTTIKPSELEMVLTEGIAVPDIEARNEYVLPEFREFMKRVQEGI